MSDVEWDRIPNCRSSIYLKALLPTAVLVNGTCRKLCNADRRVLEGVLRLMRGERYAGEPVWSIRYVTVAILKWMRRTSDTTMAEILYLPPRLYATLEFTSTPTPPRGHMFRRPCRTALPHSARSAIYVSVFPGRWCCPWWCRWFCSDLTIAMRHSSVSQPTSWADCSLCSTPLHDLCYRGASTTTSSETASVENWAADRVQALSTRLPLPERPGSVILILRPTTRVRPGGSSTPAFLVNVDARRPADTPFYRRWPRFPCGCGADMEQPVEISHNVIFTGVL